MSILAQQQAHYKAVRARLMNPPNKWKPKLVVKEPEPIDIKAHFKEVMTPQTPNYRPPMKKAIMDFAEKTPWSYEEIVGPSRHKPLVEARFDCIAYVRRMFPKASLTQMGRAFNKDHTSILHSLRRRGFYPDYSGTKKERYEEAIAA